LALIWSLPLALAAAVFLNESRSKWRRPVRIFVDAMSGLPSIIAGLFIYAFFVIPYADTTTLFNFNGFLACLALAITMLPTIRGRVGGAPRARRSAEASLASISQAARSGRSSSPRPRAA
jgi:phosphate transport system permease protein